MVVNGCYYNKPTVGVDFGEGQDHLVEYVLIHKEEFKRIQEEMQNLREIEAEHRKINGELRKKEQKTTEALELINSYILEILNKQKK